ncbi:unnamed protein product [Peniophora sp. CBMAI 1063]|nr:unnamed protein product [Peniophora sp. CBMAI 1063]
MRTATHIENIVWADVANDGRVLASRDERYRTVSPVSRLYQALRMMPHLTSLRVFDCRQGLQAPDNLRLHGRVQLRSEEALFPNEHVRMRLQIYELHHEPRSRSLLFVKVQPDTVRTLRLSGNCTLPNNLSTTSLRSLVLDTVTGSYLDLRSLHEIFVGANLDDFAYRMGHPLAFEMRDSHLHSLPLLGRNLRRLVLLGCSRFSSISLQEVLAGLHELKHLALDIITVLDSDLKHDFISPLPVSLIRFKFSISNEKSTVEHIEEETLLANAVELLLRRRNPPKLTYLHLRDAIFDRGGRRTRLQHIAKAHEVRLVLGDWRNENDMYDEEIM